MYTQIEKAAKVIRALNNPLRFKLLELLKEKGEMTVTDIITTLAREQSIVSQQLGILRKEGIVKFRKEGKFLYYSVDNDRLSDILKKAESLFTFTE